jgi:alkylglycerol monooxygenase
LLVDFIYYWFHRNSHNIAVIWGSHEAHHSSQEYNLSVALRQGAFQRLFSFPYYLPMALIGFSPLAVHGLLADQYALPVFYPHAPRKKTGFS